MFNQFFGSEKYEFAERESSKLSSISKGQSPKRAQGTIEYLVIIAVVVVIALVVVGLLTGFFGSGVTVSSTSNKIGGLVQSIGVTESLVDPSVDGNFVVRLLNNSGGTITVSNVRIGDSNASFSVDLVQSGSKFFPVTRDLSCELGKVVSQSVVITYVTVDGLVKSMVYPSQVMFDCSPFVIAQANLANQCPSVGGSGITPDGNATASNVLSGYSFYGNGLTKLNGSLWIGSYLHSKQNRCWKTDNTEVACGSADGNTIYQDARMDGNVANFTDLTNGTVRDNFTGLIWQKAGTSTPMTWYNALGYCALLNLGGYSVGSWRLPSRLELDSFADLNCSAASANCTAKFININFTQTGWDSSVDGYWSSTTVPSSTYYAYTLDSGSGYILDGSKTSGSYYGARCVRSP